MGSPRRNRRFRARPRPLLTALVCGLLWLPPPLSAAETETEPLPGRLAPPVPNADSAYQQAEDRYRQQPRDAQAAWQLGKACFDMADGARSRQERVRYAERGIAVTKSASQLHTNCAGCFYFLGLNYGQLARTRTIGALRLIRPMQDALESARRLDATFDFGGPDRTLGLLYRDAPAWIVGDRKRAREHLTRATDLAPSYPDNRLELIAALIEWGERKEAQKQLDELERLLPKSKSEFAEPRWEQSWLVWERQRLAAQAKLRKG
jgi:tetratricopeptide (TPR) repeat protein